jgi:hypothetical protein
MPLDLHSHGAPSTWIALLTAPVVNASRLRCQASSTFPDPCLPLRADTSSRASQREEQSFVAKLAAHSRTPSSRSADTKRVPSGPFHELPNPVSPWLVKSSLSRRPRRGSLLDNRTQYSLFRGIQRVRGQLLPVKGV